MKYHMRRQDRQVKDAEIAAIFREGKHVVLSLCRENEPYIVTLSYGFDQSRNCLYLHCAKDGLKLDFLSANPMVCGTVILDRGYVDNECGHPFETVVFRGLIRIAETLDEKRHGIQTIIGHLESNPQAIMQRALKTDAVYDTIQVLRLDIAEATGKKGR